MLILEQAQGADARVRQLCDELRSLGDAAVSPSAPQPAAGEAKSLQAACERVRELLGNSPQVKVRATRPLRAASAE